jgi:hypothetical protein
VWRISNHRTADKERSYGLRVENEATNPPKIKKSAFCEILYRALNLDSVEKPYATKNERKMIGGCGLESCDGGL